MAEILTEGCHHKTEMYDILAEIVRKSLLASMNIPNTTIAPKCMPMELYTLI